MLYVSGLKQLSASERCIGYVMTFSIQISLTSVMFCFYSWKKKNKCEKTYVFRVRGMFVVGSSGVGRLDE
jgi:hypothetical protein